jgi:hypothetical protein
MFLNLNTEVANQLASGIVVTGFEPAAAGGLAPQAYAIGILKMSRGDRIRTCGLFVPNEARYRAALHPVLQSAKVRTAAYHI